MNRTYSTKAYQTQTGDIAKVRQVANNADLSESEVYYFPKFLICKSGKNHNATDIVGDAQKAVVNDWVGKPIFFEDHKESADNQIGRIYHAWTAESGEITETYGAGYGIQTDLDQSTFAKIDGGVHQEINCLGQGTCPGIGRVKDWAGLSL